METYFSIENNEFVDYLKLTVNNKTYYFCDNLTVDFADCESLDIDIEFVRAEEYFSSKSKNILLKLLLSIVKWIFSPLIFFIDNDDGIRLDKGYKSFNPYTCKKSFSIMSPNEKKFKINYTCSKYNRFTKKYTPLDISIQGEGVICKTEEITFSKSILKSEWNNYHISAYTVIMVIILLMNGLTLFIAAKVIREISMSPISENIGDIVAISFCSLIMIALFITYIVIILKACRLLKEVISKNL